MPDSDAPGDTSVWATMTDGCGLLNVAAARAIAGIMDYVQPPSAYQGETAGLSLLFLRLWLGAGRIAGSKGLWILHPTDTSPTPKIWIRGSQRKCRLRGLRDPHKIFNLLAVSRPSRSVTLSSQSLVILAHNGVPVDVLREVQERALRALVEPLMDWERPHAMACLWDAVNVAGGVTRSRLQRMTHWETVAFDLDLDRNYRADRKDASEYPDLGGRNSYSGGERSDSLPHRSLPTESVRAPTPSGGRDGVSRGRVQSCADALGLQEARHPYL